MERRSLALGLVLVGLGVGPWLGSGGASVTALIPAFFGVAIAAAGLLALRSGYAGRFNLAALVLALLGFLGSARGLAALPALLSAAGEQRAPPRAGEGGARAGGWAGGGGGGALGGGGGGGALPPAASSIASSEATWPLNQISAA